MLPAPGYKDSGKGVKWLINANRPAVNEVYAQFLKLRRRIFKWVESSIQTWMGMFWG